jgi:hypothetical protein
MIGIGQESSMRKTIPTVALTALALASAAMYAQAATTAAAPAPAGSVIANPGRTTSGPLVTRPGMPVAQTSMDNGAFSPAVSNPSAATPSTSGTSTSTSTSTTGAMAPAATNVTTNAASTNANPNPFGPNSTFANDNGNPELGQSPGQSSSGTLVGNSSSGIGTGTETLGNPAGNGVSTNGTAAAGTSLVAPVGVTGAGFGYGMAGGAATPSYSASPDTTVAVPATTPTPLLNAVTNAEINKEARARAEGRTPRIIGIAPRTDVDRTNQMPDDPIIRY